MKLLDETIRIAKKAGKLLVKAHNGDLTIREKGINDLVTNADHASEDLIIKEIKKVYPSHAILAEESAVDLNASIFKDSKYIWIIDPLDGTTNYSHGLPIYCVSIGVFKTKTVKSSTGFDYLTGELVAGVVYAPEMNELYHAYKGKGAYLNDEKIHVSDNKKLKDSLTVTGFTTTGRERNIPHFQIMLHRCQAIRRLGAAALDLCWIANGRFDGYWEFGLKPWDVAAGSLIIKEAGGRVSDTNGNLLDLFGQDILASNGKIHREMINAFDSV